LLFFEKTQFDLSQGVLMITLVTGVPGGGKSYYSVYQIRERLKKNNEQFLILQNIEGLQVFDPRCIPFEPSQEKFTVDYMDKKIPELRKKKDLAQDANIDFYIDEASDFFPSDMRNNDVIDFFKKHRHYGINIFLITQNRYDIHKRLEGIVGEEVRAVNPRINPIPGFTYKLLSKGEAYKTFRLKKDREVFSMYKSFMAGKDHSKKNHTMRNLILLFVFVFGAAVFFFFRNGIVPGVEPQNKKAAQARAQVKKLSDPQPKKKSTSEYISYSNNIEPVDYSFRPPKPIKYDKSQDKILLEGEFDLWIKVADYLKQYPPSFYNYAVFHVPNKQFLVASADFSHFVYPADYAFPATSQSSSHRQTRAARAIDRPEPVRVGAAYPKSPAPAPSSRAMSSAPPAPGQGPGAFYGKTDSLTLQDKVDRLRYSGILDESQRVLD